MSGLLAVTAEAEEFVAQAQRAAQEYDLRFVEPGRALAEFGALAYLLVFSTDGVSLRCLADPRRKPVRIDFLSERERWRRAVPTQHTLAKAIGRIRGQSLRVVDATAGLGGDGLLLAQLGCTVSLCERSPVAALLLADGLRRAVVDPGLKELIETRISLHIGDATEYLQALAAGDAIDVVYLDPMFPTRPGSALPRKEMQAFHDLIGADPDAEKLLNCALSVARRRVVVKRPRHAEPVGQRQPDFTLPGQSTRFDVYVLMKRKY